MNLEPQPLTMTVPEAAKLLGGCDQGVGGFLSRSRRAGADCGDQAGRHRRTKVPRDQHLLQIFVIAGCERRLE